MSTAPLEQRLLHRTRELGFDLAGIAPATPADGFAHLQEWLAQGFAGAMDYMSRHADARQHPRSVLPEVRSVVMVGLNYFPGGVEHEHADGLHGRVARYACGADYHEIMRHKLNDLLAWAQIESPGILGRGVVDTAPLLERDFARRAGLGWFGKNTMLINKRLGSYSFLGALLLDLTLTPSAPFETQHCGSCTRCLDACPTDAFAGPFQLDARRCISYLTIELRGPIPEELRAGMGDWAFGCDVCQEVCPWNRKAPQASEPLLRLGGPGRALDLIELLGMSETEFRRRFRGTALWRTRRRGLLRNAAIALGNLGDSRALPALTRALDDAEPTIREAATWAIAQLSGRRGYEAASLVPTVV